MTKDARRIVQRALDNGELVFVVRSRDMLSIEAVREYYRACAKKFGGADEFVKDMFARLQEWDDWNAKNHTKMRLPKLRSNSEIAATMGYIEHYLTNFLRNRQSPDEDFCEILNWIEYEAIPRCKKVLERQTSAETQEEEGNKDEWLLEPTEEGWYLVYDRYVQPDLRIPSVVKLERNSEGKLYSEAARHQYSVEKYIRNKLWKKLEMPLLEVKSEDIGEE